MTVKTLRLSKDLIVPIDFATEGLGVVGMRGSGKTNIEVRWCEILYKAKVPFVVIDPKGDWGGIRSSADGKSPGLPIPVFGGLYGDFPLDEHLGKRIADLLVDENMSAILDVSRMSHAARARFLTDFFEQLMDRHQREPHVRCVILEEAHRYIPQTVPNELARVKEAAASILLEGRSWGLGCWAATQRPARLNKDVMEEVGTIFVFRLGVAATNDQRTVNGWFKNEEAAKEIERSLTKLGNGEAWVHAPATLGIIQRVQMDRRTTFDSAATPLVGASGKPVATMASIDSAAIKEALSDAIEKAKENDPLELKKLVAAQRIELGKRPSIEDGKELGWWRNFALKFAPGQIPEIGSAFTGLGPLYLAGAPVAPDPVEVPFVPDHLLDTRDRLLDAATVLAGTIRDLSTGIDVAVKDAASVRKSGPKKREPRVVSNVSARDGVVPVAPVEEPVRVESEISGSLPVGERRILTVAVQRTAGASLSEILLITGLKKSSVKTYVTRLKKKKFISTEGSRVLATDEGRAEIGDVDPLPTGDALRAYWINELPEGESKILGVLIGAYPHTMSRSEIISMTGYEDSTVKTYVTRLKARELIVVEDGEPRVSAILFDG